MTDLVRYDEMCRAISECRAVDEVKTIRDKAKALAEYLRQAKDREQARYCDEIRIRAEIGAGRLLREQAESGERHTGAGDQRTESRHAIPKLKDLGVSNDQSSKWQQMSEAYDADPSTAEDYLRHDERPSTNGFLDKCAPQRPEYSKDGLWLWGRMRDFRDMVLHQDPKVVYDGMAEHMQKEFNEILPEVLKWLNTLR